MERIIECKSTLDVDLADVRADVHELRLTMMDYMGLIMLKNDQVHMLVPKIHDIRHRIIDKVGQIRINIIDQKYPELIQSDSAVRHENYCAAYVEGTLTAAVQSAFDAGNIIAYSKWCNDFPVLTPFLTR